MKIRFAKYDFDGPYAVAGWRPPAHGGIYAVMVYDPAYHPLPYRVVYFGQAHDLSKRGLLRTHPKHSDWLAAAAGRDRSLYVATYGMPGSTELTRLALETHLVHHYQPECNEPVTTPGPSPRKALRTHKYN